MIAPFQYGRALPSPFPECGWHRPYKHIPRLEVRPDTLCGCHYISIDSYRARDDFGKGIGTNDRENCVFRAPALPAGKGSRRGYPYHKLLTPRRLEHQKVKAYLDTRCL